MEQKTELVRQGPAGAMPARRSPGSGPEARGRGARRTSTIAACAILAFAALILLGLLYAWGDSMEWNRPGDPRFGGLWRALAVVGPFFIPTALALGILLLAVERGRVVRPAVPCDPPQGPANASWTEFEQLVPEYFRQQGFGVSSTQRDGRDDAILADLRCGNQYWLVRCQPWRDGTVGEPVVRGVYRVMDDQGATGAYILSFGRFTREAEEFASGRPIILMNAARLIEKVRNGGAVARSSAWPRVRSEPDRRDDPVESQ